MSTTIFIGTATVLLVISFLATTGSDTGTKVIRTALLLTAILGLHEFYQATLYTAPEPVIILEQAEEEIDIFKDEAFEQATQLGKAFIPNTKYVKVCVDFIYCAIVNYSIEEETYRVYLDGQEVDDGMAPNLITKEFSAVQHVVTDYFYKQLRQ
jgi:hypothetical protein